MSRNEEGERELFHTRAVTCHGYHRADGLWDIEGQIVDTKSHPLDLLGGKRVEAGDPIHRMRLRITVDDEYVIRGAEAHTDACPYADCADITPSYAQLVGLRIGPWFASAVRDRVGGVAGCTHITELLGPIATTAFQTIAAGRRWRDESRDGARKAPWSIDGSRLLDSCYALRRNGEIASKHFGQGAGGRNEGQRGRRGSGTSDR